jgi:hypothetical protein
MNTNFFHQDLDQPYRPLYINFDRNMSRLSADISYEDKNLIKLVCPKRGILNQITQLFFSSICNELKQNGITHYSPDNEQRFVELILRRTTIKLTRKVNKRNVDRGTPRTYPTAP